MKLEDVPEEELTYDQLLRVALNTVMTAQELLGCAENYTRAESRTRWFNGKLEGFEYGLYRLVAQEHRLAREQKEHTEKAEVDSIP